MRQDPIADALYVINNAEINGASSVEMPASKITGNILDVMKGKGYIGGYETKKEGVQGRFVVKLIGKINKSRAIKPRFSVRKDEYEKWESRYLPAHDVGILIISTPFGVMSQKDAEEKNTGGRLLAYVY